MFNLIASLAADVDPAAWAGNLQRDVIRIIGAFIVIVFAWRIFKAGKDGAIGMVLAVILVGVVCLWAIGNLTTIEGWFTALVSRWTA